MPIQLFPFNGGINEQVDTRLLPNGVLAACRNVELTREGRLVGRAKYTAQATSTFSGGALFAYDLFTLNDRLFAIGGFASSAAKLPFDFFEYAPNGLGAVWRPSSQSVALSPRIPRATNVRDMARPPDQPGSISNMGCAAGSGYACLVWNSSTDATLGYVFIAKASDNQPLVFEALTDGGLSHPCRLLRAVALSDRFLLLGLTSAGTGVSLARWLIASDLSVHQVATALLSGGAITIYAACKVAGSDQICVVANIAGTITLKRFDSAGSNQAPSGGAYATVSAVPTALAVEASSSANQINVAMVVGGEARIFSYNLATGASIGAGPFVPFTGETSIEVSLTRQSATVVLVVSSVTSEPSPTIMARQYTVASNTFGTLTRAVTDAQLTTSAVTSSEGYAYFGVRFGLGTVGNTPNALMGLFSFAGGVTDSGPQIVKDLEIAGTASALLPDVTQDASTGYYYWTNATANPDGDLAPQITEFQLDSTDRRQVAQFGDLAYVAGGVPLVFDGVTGVESGFLERPRIISLTPSNGAGALLNAGTYNYRAHWEWIDSDQNLHLSPPSAIAQVTLGASDDTIAAVVTSPHSLRRNRTVVGGSVRCVLSRSIATVANVAATVLGSQYANPPTSSVNGKTLTGQFFVGASVFNFSVTFGVGDISSTAIAAAITLQTAGSVIATDEGGFIRLTTLDVGAGVFLYAFATDAGAILGFSTAVFGTGTTTRTVGENFQRAAASFSGVTDAVAAYVTVTDLRKDQSSPILDSDLIRQPVLYSQGSSAGAHHAPPSGDALFAARERIVVVRQPNRGRYTDSKPIVPGEPAEFANPGLVAFSGLVTGEIEAGFALGDSQIFWTRKHIWLVTGAGPDRAGKGAFFAAQVIDESVGMIADGWRSLVRDEMGVWFQGSDSQLYRVRGSGAAEWVGRAVQDTLALYPVVTAAAYVPSKREVAFACQSSNGLSGGILRYQENGKSWFFDDVGACSALVAYQGGLAIVQAGTVLIQDAAPGSGTFVSYAVKTGMFQGFDGLGYGELRQVGALLTYRGPCTFEILSSDEGATFGTSLGQWSLTGAEYAVGDRVMLLAQPVKMARESFALEFSVTGTSNSEGVWLHAAAVDTEKQPGFVRLGASKNL